MADQIPDSKAAELADLIARGRKIEAIKLYRELTGVGLKEAKDAVESLEVSVSRTTPESLPTEIGLTGTLSKAILPKDTLAEISACLFRGDKIEAIKRYREATHVGLKEAKDRVESLEESLRSTAPGKFTAIPSRKGCFGQAAVFCLCGVAALYWWTRT